MSFNPYLTNPPSQFGPSWPLPKVNKEELQIAWEAYWSGNYQGAKKLTEDYLNSYKSGKHYAAGLFLYMKSAMRENINTFVKDIIITGKIF